LGGGEDTEINKIPLLATTEEGNEIVAAFRSRHQPDMPFTTAVCLPRAH